MTRLTRLKGKEIVRILDQEGFRVVRTRGSHAELKHPDGKTTVVPLHSTKQLARSFSEPSCVMWKYPPTISRNSVDLSPS